MGAITEDISVGAARHFLAIPLAHPRLVPRLPSGLLNGRHVLTQSLGAVEHATAHASHEPHLLPACVLGVRVVVFRVVTGDLGENAVGHLAAALLTFG